MADSAYDVVLAKWRSAARLSPVERAELEQRLDHYRSGTYAMSLACRASRLSAQSPPPAIFHGLVATYLTCREPWLGWYLDEVVSRAEAYIMKRQDERERTGYRRG